MKRIRAFAQALSSVLAREGLPGVRSYGTYVPYLYPATLSALRHDEVIEWLDERFLAQRAGYLDILRHARQFSDLFASWREADPHDVSRPRFNQVWFAGLDGAMAYASVRRLQPARIVEVGSGHSTRFMARAIRDGNLPTHLHSIDPQPRRDIDQLCDTMTRDSVTRVPLSVFDSLQANDVLFIDGSHAMLPGSDVDYLFTRVMPRLAAGVAVHVHDIFLPAGYPSQWHRRAYTEQGVLAAMLAGGSRFEVVAPNAWLRRNEPDAVEAVGMHLQRGGWEAGFWMKVRAGE